jgi:hypothetical protein
MGLVLGPQPFSMDVLDLTPLRELALPTASIAACPSGEVDHSGVEPESVFQLRVGTGVGV